MIDNNDDVCLGQYGELLTGPSTVAMKEDLVVKLLQYYHT